MNTQSKFQVSYETIPGTSASGYVATYFDPDAIYTPEAKNLVKELYEEWTDYNCSTCGHAMKWANYRWKPRRIQGRKQHEKKCRNINFNIIAHLLGWTRKLRRGEGPVDGNDWLEDSKNTNFNYSLKLNNKAKLQSIVESPSPTVNSAKEWVIEPNPGPSKRGEPSSEGLAAAASAAVSKKAKARVKADIKRALKPASAPIKKGIDEARKWVDKAARKVPVLGPLAALPVDVIGDIANDILIDEKSKRKSGKFVPDRLKWQVPEFVDKLANGEIKTANKLAVELNPGPPKSRRTQKKKKAYRSKRKGKGPRSKGLTLRGLMSSAKIVGNRKTTMRGIKWKNKKTGASTSGLRMSTSEYLWTTTISGTTAKMGDEVISNGLIINPHELNIAELNIEVQRWELYRIKPHIKMEAISNGTVDCELFGYYDPDPTDTIPVDSVKRLQVAETHGGSPGYVSKGHAWTPNSKRIRATAAKWFYCDKAGSTGADVRQADQYRFRLFVKRPPKLYGYNAGVASSAGVDLTINLRISYTIEFRNRTLDNVSSSVASGSLPMGVASSSPQITTTSMTGLVSSSSPSNYVVYGAGLSFKRPIIMNNAGANDVIYKPSQGLVCSKYVMITIAASASTLTGAPSVGSVVNLTSWSNKVATGSNNSVSRLFYYVTDVNLLTSGTLTSPCTFLGGSLLGSKSNSPTSINYYSSGIGTFNYHWAINLGNWTAATTPTSFTMEVCEFNEGNELAKLNWHGPCTVEGIAFQKFKAIPLPKRPEWPDFFEQFSAKRAERSEEVDYWRKRALGTEFDKDYHETKEHKLSLTPSPSEDEEDWEAFQAFKNKATVLRPQPIRIIQDDEKSEKSTKRASSQK